MEKDISKIEYKLKLVLEKEKGILFGYLFGSVALGKGNLESDIDLNVINLRIQEQKDIGNN